MECVDKLTKLCPLLHTPGGGVRISPSSTSLFRQVSIYTTGATTPQSSPSRRFSMFRFVPFGLLPDAYRDILFLNQAPSTLKVIMLAAGPILSGDHSPSSAAPRSLTRILV